MRHSNIPFLLHEHYYMRSKITVLSNFSRARHSESQYIRPANEQELIDYVVQHHPDMLLARGSGLSYSDSCLNQDGVVIDTSRFNHFLEFDADTGIVICQGGVTFKELFLLDSQFIPPVVPGTQHATIAGSIAHDVHGKNNAHAGSLGQHLIWFDLLIGDRILRCSREEHRELFYATIGGLGLTGIITRCALRLKKASHYVAVANTKFESLKDLIQHMETFGLHHEYQVAWLDLLHTKFKALHSMANHCEPFTSKAKPTHTIPKLPFRLITSWNMRWFNQLYIKSQSATARLTFQEFNNPLDNVVHWHRVYGSSGLLQFQAVFDQDNALYTLEHLVQLIKNYQAIPTLAVLKLFIQSGVGLLSFCRPGFTVAIDFINNKQGTAAIKAMNQFITEINGRVYLAKDLLLSPEQFHKMYNKEQEFTGILLQHQSVMRSDLAIRLGII